MVDLTIRSAAASDLDKLAELKLSLQLHLEASNPRIWRLTEEGKSLLTQRVEQMLADEDGRVVVAVKDEDLVGFAYGRVHHRTDYSPNTVGEISLIYVSEKSRRRGVGSRLAKELCRFFGSQSVEEVTLRYVVGNGEAQRFWGVLGLKPVILIANTHLEGLSRNLNA